MSRSSNFGLSGLGSKTCDGCKTAFSIFQRWAEGPAAKPPACTACGKDFLDWDKGDRTDSLTNKPYKANFTVEIYALKAGGQKTVPNPNIPGLFKNIVQTMPAAGLSSDHSSCVS
jgi:hypothetical protein